MNSIKLEQISEDEVEVLLPPETPLEMVQQLTKGLIARGLVEDLSKSTVSVRYFKRPADKANVVADELIKSLKKLSKDDELPYWHPKAQMANQKRVREMDISDRRAAAGIVQPPKPSTPSQGGPSTLPGVTNQLYSPSISGTVNYKKSENDHVDGCQCDACLDMEKSGYGPKKGGQYNPADNARRKMNNVGDVAGQGPNVNVKAYSTKPGQLSGKASADLTARLQNKANKKQPVKVLTPEEIAQQYPGQVKKSWGQHYAIPSAEEEIMKFAGRRTPQGDEAMANQLATMMHSKAMLSNHNQPTPAEFDAAGEAMGLGVSEEMAKTAEKSWHGTINNWMVEAQKPISSRFSSEEEEVAYWRSIRVTGSKDDDTGY